MANGRASKKGGDSLEDFKKDFKKIGARIRELRKSQGFAGAEGFSNTHGFDRKTFGEWEAGKPMSVQSILRICKAVGISLEEFFKGL